MGSGKIEWKQYGALKGRQTEQQWQDHPLGEAR
jgi:hypothetical protein